MRFTRRSSRDGFTGPVLFAGFLLGIAALATTAVVRRPAIIAPAKPNVAASHTDEEAPHYTGSIVIPAAGNALCRHLLFDNVTGQIREVEARACSEFDPSINSTESRIGAIRRSFTRNAE